MIETFEDDVPGLSVDFCDGEGCVNDWDEFMSWLLVTFPLYVEVDLVTEVD